MCCCCERRLACSAHSFDVPAGTWSLCTFYKDSNATTLLPRIVAVLIYSRVAILQYPPIWFTVFRTITVLTIQLLHWWNPQSVSICFFLFFFRLSFFFLFRFHKIGWMRLCKALFPFIIRNSATSNCFRKPHSVFQMVPVDFFGSCLDGGHCPALSRIRVIH